MISVSSSNRIRLFPPKLIWSRTKLPEPSRMPFWSWIDNAFVKSVLGFIRSVPWTVKVPDESKSRFPPERSSRPSVSTKDVPPRSRVPSPSERYPCWSSRPSSNSKLPRPRMIWSEAWAIVSLLLSWSSVALSPNKSVLP